MENRPLELRLGEYVLSRLETALGHEWIVTNGLGGYSSSTILGINTRKYHGLLVASFNPPVDRRVVLSKLDEQLVVGDKVSDIGANEFASGVQPQGYRHLRSFSRFPFPKFVYEIDEVELHKTVLMPHQRNVTAVLYEAIAPRTENITMRISPLIDSRHFHSTTSKDQVEGKLTQDVSSRRMMLHVAEPQSTLIVSSNLGTFIEHENWVTGIFFRVDSSQGTSCFNDCYVPGRFEVELRPEEKASLMIVAAAGKEKKQTENLHSRTCEELREDGGLYRKEQDRLTGLLAKFFNQHQNVFQEEWLRWLILAADSFIVTRSSTKMKTVIAGYHWFEDWGRDSLISLPGLTLVTGRFEDAQEILQTFERYCREGIVPNRFPDEAGESPVYNTVDATLWFFNAALQYLKYTGDFDFVEKKLWATLQSVINYHIQGTINNIRLDNDGLIAHGPQLTWMDAMTDGHPATPRQGKAVEIQALWFNALKVMEMLANRFGSQNLADEYRNMAKKAETSFDEKFWNAREHCLFDVIENHAKDSSIRPNQILAISLDFPILSKDKQPFTVSKVREKLWIPYGLRTLSAKNPKYRGKYSGSWTERTFAYHNGTAWPWLLGPFVTAFLKVKKYSAKSRGFAFENFLQPLFNEQTLRAGLGTLSEVYDGDPPHLPGGCVSQAWSVAEPLRALVEDVWFDRPNFEGIVLEHFSSEKA